MVNKLVDEHALTALMKLGRDPERRESGDGPKTVPKGIPRSFGMFILVFLFSITGTIMIAELLPSNVYSREGQVLGRTEADSTSLSSLPSTKASLFHLPSGPEDIEASMNMSLLPCITPSSVLERALQDQQQASNLRGAAGEGGEDTASQSQSQQTFEHCKYDNVGKFLEEIQSKKDVDTGNTTKTVVGIVHKPVPAIPSYRRIPHEMANNWTYIAQRKAAPDRDASNSALQDYNPVILPLYNNNNNNSNDDGPSSSSSLSSDLDPKLLNYITGKYHPDFTDEQTNEVQYIMISRSTNHHNCPGGRARYKWSNNMVIALLDSNLQMIDGADAAINFEEYYISADDPRAYLDYQIFAARTTRGLNKRDQLFVVTTGFMHSHMFPIDIRRVPKPTNDGSDWVTKIKGSDPLPMILDEESEGQKRIMYGTGLQIRLLQSFKNRSDAEGGDGLGGSYLSRGKNFHFFEPSQSSLATTTLSEEEKEEVGSMTFMEIWPHDHHFTRPINLYAESYTTFDDLDLFPESSKEIMQRSVSMNGHLSGETIDASDYSDTPSLLQQDGINLRPPLVRGTSGLVDMTLDGHKVKVGIAHSVVQESRSYLSRFYAFVPVPPFQVVAYSGYFCMSPMQPTDVGYDDHWVSKSVATRTVSYTRVTIGQEVNECPNISFVSGFTEMIGHGGEYTVISYGVHDCYSKSIIVSKRKIEVLLLGNNTSPINWDEVNSMNGK